MDVLTSRYEEVACLTWFDKNGQMYPKMLKYQDKEHRMHTIQGIHSVILSDISASIVYQCATIMYNRKKEFQLIYFKRDHTWKIYWKY